MKGLADRIAASKVASTSAVAVAGAASTASGSAGPGLDSAAPAFEPPPSARSSDAAAREQRAQVPDAVPEEPHGDALEDDHDI